MQVKTTNEQVEGQSITPCESSTFDFGRSAAQVAGVSPASHAPRATVRGYLIRWMDGGTMHTVACTDRNEASAIALDIGLTHKLLGVFEIR